jgi:hypothetical protein
MPMSTSSNISLDENDSFFKFKYPQDLRFRLRTTHWKISDKDLTDAGPSNVNIVTPVTVPTFSTRAPRRSQVLFHFGSLQWLLADGSSFR